MSEDKFTQYFHIENLEEVPKIFELPEVIVTEKVHGSAMRLAVLDGALRIGGRRLAFTDLRPESKEGLGFVSWVFDTGLERKMVEAFQGQDIIFYGEWHGSGTPKKGWPQIQKGIRYVEGNDFRLFDIKVSGKYLPHAELAPWAAKVGLKTMPVLYHGKPDGNLFNSLIDNPSKVAEENGLARDPENTIEGIVIRPPEPMWDEKRNPIIAKYKIGKWAERASQKKRPTTPRPEAPVPPGAEAFAEEFVTMTRLEHVLDQLREAAIPIGKSSLGEVMKRMGQDVKREGGGALVSAQLEWKDVSPFVTKRTKSLFLEYTKDLIASSG